MEKNKYLKYCKYYKGEDKPPTETTRTNGKNYFLISGMPEGATI